MRYKNIIIGTGMVLILLLLVPTVPAVEYHETIKDCKTFIQKEYSREKISLRETNSDNKFFYTEIFWKNNDPPQPQCIILLLLLLKILSNIIGRIVQVIQLISRVFNQIVYLVKLLVNLIDHIIAFIEWLQELLNPEESLHLVHF